MEAQPKKSNTLLIVLIVVIVLIVLCCCCVAAAFIFSGPVIGEVFSNIVEGLEMTPVY